MKISKISYLQRKIEDIDVEIAELIAEKNANNIKNHYLNMTEGGSFNVVKMWKLRQQILPKKGDFPNCKKGPFWKSYL